MLWVGDDPLCNALLLPWWVFVRRMVDMKLVSQAPVADDMPKRWCGCCSGLQHKYRWKCCRNTPETQYRATGFTHELRKLRSEKWETAILVEVIIILYTPFNRVVYTNWQTHTRCQNSTKIKNEIDLTPPSQTTENYQQKCKQLNAFNTLSLCWDFIAHRWRYHFTNTWKGTHLVELWIYEIIIVS